MTVLSSVIRRIFSNIGIDTRRLSSPTLRLDDFLKRAIGAYRDRTEIHVFDDDPRTLKAIYSFFDEKSIFLHPNGSGENSMGLGDSNGIARWAIINLERVHFKKLLDNDWYFRRSRYVLVSASVWAFNSGICDFIATIERCSELGLELLDVAVSTEPVVLNSAQTQVFLIFAIPKAVNAYKESRSRRLLRIDEAAAFLPTPAAQRSTFRWLSLPGSFGYKAGTFNPGAISRRSKILLLLRGEDESWNSQKRSELKHFGSWKMELASFEDKSGIVAHKALTFTSALPKGGHRVEDFRLFSMGDQIFSNHAVISLPSDRQPLPRRVDLESRIVRMGLSELLESNGELQFKGFLSIDIGARTVEKNWAMFTIGAEVYIIYSISPYRVLRAQSWPGLSFATKVHSIISLPINNGAYMVRNSINPVDYDELHLLHIVHMVHPSKQYVFWAMLIEKRSLTPRFFCQTPLVRVGSCAPGAIVYLCSVIVESTRVFLFAGINDSSSGVWEVERSFLDSRWRALK